MGKESRWLSRKHHEGKKREGACRGKRACHLFQVLLGAEHIKQSGQQCSKSLYMPYDLPLILASVGWCRTSNKSGRDVAVGTPKTATETSCRSNIQTISAQGISAAWIVTHPFRASPMYPNPKFSNLCEAQIWVWKVMAEIANLESKCNLFLNTGYNPL